jgi:Xaa-Pro aminopeptidase
VLASLELQHDLGVDLLYRVELVPRLWELTLSHHSRVYANETFHKVAERVLAQGFIDLGLCKGALDEVLETGSYKQYYMHRAGHWLGMDVHDAGLYQAQGKSIRLAPGMVLTVEPGAYIRPADNVPEAFWNIGVRIEDDLVVTDAGSENLTAAAPKTVSEVEAACRTA